MLFLIEAGKQSNSTTVIWEAIMKEYEDAFIVDHDLEIHPCALIMPPMDDDTYEKFKVDISGHGLIHPIVLYQGKVLDGRNRYNACKELDKENNIQSRDLAGKQFDVSGRSVSSAKFILEHGTEEEIENVETNKAALRPTEEKIRERIKEIG